MFKNKIHLILILVIIALIPMQIFLFKRMQNKVPEGTPVQSETVGKAPNEPTQFPRDVGTKPPDKFIMLKEPYTELAEETLLKDQNITLFNYSPNTIEIVFTTEQITVKLEPNKQQQIKLGIVGDTAYTINVNGKEIKGLVVVK